MAAVCRRCGTCVASCPKKADIPELLRAQMYAFNYGNPAQARDTLENVSPGRGLDACRACGTCLAICANRVMIGRRIDRLRDAFA